ncbi:MAG: DUF4129 domain-containing protein, partial [Candidatus Limnocylindria bacterium]
ALLAIIVLRVWVRRRLRRPTRGGSEERTFSIPQGSFRLRAPRLPGVGRSIRRGYPTDAVSAYLAALGELESHDPPHARRPHETPRGHAARVAGPEIAMLQADYALARYGYRPLSDAEQRRAIGRWRRLRDRIRRLH